MVVEAERVGGDRPLYAGTWGGERVDTVHGENYQVDIVKEYVLANQC